MNRGTRVTSDGHHESAAEKLGLVRDAIAAATKDAGRAPGSTKLIAVSKTFEAAAFAPLSPPATASLAKTGCRKPRPNGRQLRAEYPGSRTASHRPPAIQQGKGGGASVRRHPYASTGRRSPRRSRPKWQDRAASCSFSCRSIPARSRRRPACCRGRQQAFVDLCREELKLDIAGLMCIPPLDEEPAVHFAFLAKLARRDRPQSLSMGMSSRFRDGGCLRRHARARRQRDFRKPIRLFLRRTHSPLAFARLMF